MDVGGGLEGDKQWGGGRKRKMRDRLREGQFVG